jgi:hypothetical protein
LNLPETDPEALKEAMGELNTEPPKEKEVATAKKKTKTAEKSAPKKKAAAAADPNVVSLKELAAEFKITTTAARRKLRAADLKADGRWKWEKDSSALKKARAALEADEEEASE